jgi:hypothetical protein
MRTHCVKQQQKKTQLFILNDYKSLPPFTFYEKLLSVQVERELIRLLTLWRSAEPPQTTTDEQGWRKERTMPDLKIRMFKSGEAKPKTTVTIPAGVFKIASKLIPSVCCRWLRPFSGWRPDERDMRE